MISNIYFFYGNESYLIEEKTREIIALIEKDYGSFYLEHLDSEISLGELLLALDSLPLGFFKRVLFLKNPKFLKKKLNKKEETQLLSYFEKPNPEVIFLLSLDEVDKPTTFLKKMAEKSTSFFIKPLTEDNLRAFFFNEAKKRNKTLKSNVYPYLMRKAKELPLSILVNDIEKASLYQTEKNSLGLEIFEKIGVVTVDETIFTLLDGVVEKNIKKAYAAWEDLSFLGESPQKVIYQLIDELKRILLVKFLRLRGDSPKEIESFLKKHPFVVKKAIRAAGHLDEKALGKALSYLLEEDIAFKSGVYLDQKGKMSDLLVQLITILEKRH